MGLWLVSTTEGSFKGNCSAKSSKSNETKIKQKYVKETGSDTWITAFNEPAEQQLCEYGAMRKKYKYAKICNTVMTKIRNIVFGGLQA